MKIGLIGPATTVYIIKETIEREFPNVELLTKATSFFEESDAITKELQEGQQVDCLLFSGPSNYDYTLARIKPTIPWGYLAHNRVSLFKALLDASFIYHKEFKNISLDTYEEELLEEILQSLHIEDWGIYKSPYVINNTNLENKHLQFHKECYKKYPDTLCLTSVEHVQEPLNSLGIPCIRILPSKEAIVDQVKQLHIRLLEKEKNAKADVAVIGIMTNFNYDELDLDTRELEKVRYSRGLMEQIYFISQKLQAAVFRGEFVHYYIVTTRDRLKRIFISEGHYSKLLNLHKLYPKGKVWLGIGLGTNSLEAQSRAAMALNQTYHISNNAQAFIFEDEHNGTLLNIAETMEPEEHRLSILAAQCGISSATLEKIAKAANATPGPFTSQQLAEAVGITSRSINRIIAKLEEAELVHLVGKEGKGKGRPTRLLKFNLPKE